MPKPAVRDPLAFTPEGDPVPRFDPWIAQRRRANGWSSHDQRLFIRELARIGSVSAAAKRAGKSARSAYALRDKPGAESFAVAWERALNAGLERTRERIVERLADGEILPRYHYGKLAGTIHRWKPGPLVAVLNSRARKLDGDAAARARDYDELEAYRRRLEQWEDAIVRRVAAAVQARNAADARGAPAARGNSDGDLGGELGSGESYRNLCKIPELWEAEAAKSLH